MRAGIEAEVNNPAIRDALWFGLYTGMRRDEVLTLRWERVDMDALTFRVEETKTGVPLELPITNQLAAILERRRLDHLPASRARTEDRRSHRGLDVSGGIIRDCRCLGLSTETHHRSSAASIGTTVDNGIPTV